MYNKRVQPKCFELGEKVLKVVLSIGKKNPRFSKWSPNWEGPMIIHKVLRKETYRLKTLLSEVA